ncbi:uncharacterized protein LOC141857266 [Brevipalpus obovatus]|uniref:uncharacterized protein LOC141857266 n=1 Tax=Brevipalpus obovatus TaxID=246614 RepID=UPI003D9FAF5E
MEKSGYHHQTFEERNKSVKSYQPTKKYSDYYDRNANKVKYDVREREEEIIPYNKEEEWETSKKVINHKTRQIETRIQRQILMEDGKVIADSGPQVITRTKEDQKTEESESNRKLKGDPDRPPGEGYEALPGEQVFSEKFETHNTTREAKQENMQYHDESIKELSGYDLHRKALTAPNDLVKIDENELSTDKPKGKLTHFSSKSKKFRDHEQVKETSKRDRDGTIATETVRTNHHEELDDDELPEDDGEIQALPEASRTREVHFQRDYTPDSLSSKVGKLAVEDRADSRYSSVDRAHSSMDRRSREFDRDSLDRSSRERYDRGRYSSDESRRPTPHPSAHRSRYDETPRRVHRQREPLLGRTSDDEYQHSSLSRSRDRKSFKEDASVQASFSDSSSSDDEVQQRRSQREKLERYRSEKERSRGEKYDRPARTFYFGQGEDSSRSSKHRERSYDEKPVIAQTYSTLEEERKRRDQLDRIEKSNRNLIEDLDRECGVLNKTDINGNPVGEMKGSFKHEYKSKINDKVVSDSTRNESFQRSFKTRGEREEAQKSFDRMMQDSFNKQLGEATSDLSPRRDQSKSFESYKSDKNYGRKDYDDYQWKSSSRASNRSYSPSPIRHGSSSRDRSSRVSDYHDDYSRQRVSPDSGTWTKSKGRKATARSELTKDTSDWPEFKPLSAPHEILRTSDSHKRGYY